jgi:hypothetical protein
VDVNHAVAETALIQQFELQAEIVISLATASFPFTRPERTSRGSPP